MPDATLFRDLRKDEQQALLENGCSADDWGQVQVEDPFEPARVRHVDFLGPVWIRQLQRKIKVDGLEKPAGIYHAALSNVTVGRNVRIANIGTHVANYEIGDGACIEDVGSLVTHPGARFGNGVRVAVLNEAGGREVTLFNELSAQFAYLLCLYRYQPELVQKLQVIADAYVAGQESDVGKIGKEAVVIGAGRIIDVNIGDAAVVQDAAELRNGTVLSEPDASTHVGNGVQAEDFIVAEGAHVVGGAMLKACFVGQGSQIGRQFSAENSLFFANCECFHGEAVSVFAGPYSVTHHKSTLLIAGMLSFYNAGSGTNQSNHMYKLGPVHEGKLERGCKTGSYAYLMWPCRIGPFSIILGKHKRQFDTSCFPFALIDASPEGQCNLVPGLNLSTVGTVRDGAKWPRRDRRQGTVRRDRISCQVLSPFTVGRMLQGTEILQQLQQETDKSVDTVTIRGANVKRVLLRTGQKLYRTGIEIYLLEQLFLRAEQAVRTRGTWGISIAVGPSADDSEQWLDVGGQLMPQRRLDNVVGRIIGGELEDVQAIADAFQQVEHGAADDEWAWVCQAYERVFNCVVAKLSKEEWIAAAEQLLTTKGKLIRQVLGDAQKEFENTTGFGQDGSDDHVQVDFDEVRGTYDRNQFVLEMQDELKTLEDRVAKLKVALNGL
ncbi:MAG: DUF4954 family protein [Pirellulaceae bacterium]|nr:DUF4954 family protein [Pirellulaceae bacterium]